MTIKALRLSAVTERTGLSRSTIYNLMKDGRFPTRVKLGARAVGWLEDDIADWLGSRRAVETATHIAPEVSR